MAALDDNIKTKLSGKTLQVVSFALGSEEYGVNIAQVQEINRMVTITRVPRAPQFMEGVINLRGQLIPIIDLRMRFGMEHAERTKNTGIVVTEIGSKRLGVAGREPRIFTRVSHQPTSTYRKACSATSSVQSRRRRRTSSAALGTPERSRSLRSC